MSLQSRNMESMREQNAYWEQSNVLLFPSLSDRGFMRFRIVSFYSSHFEDGLIRIRTDDFLLVVGCPFQSGQGSG